MKLLKWWACELITQLSLQKDYWGLQVKLFTYSAGQTRGWVLSCFRLVQTERESMGLVIRPCNLLKASLLILTKVINLTGNVNRLLANWGWIWSKCYLSWHFCFSEENQRWGGGPLGVHWSKLSLLLCLVWWSSSSSLIDFQKEVIQVILRLIIDRKWPNSKATWRFF